MLLSGGRMSAANVDRRRDPRRDAAFSLKNLLRVRSERHAYTLAVLGTSEGLVMAGSRDDDLAQLTAAQLSLRLFKTEEAPFGRFTRACEGARVTGLRFEVEGNELFLGVVDEGGRRDEREDDRLLDELVERVQDIFQQQRARLAA